MLSTSFFPRTQGLDKFGSAPCFRKHVSSFSQVDERRIFSFFYQFCHPGNNYRNMFLEKCFLVLPGHNRPDVITFTVPLTTKMMSARTQVNLEPKRKLRKVIFWDGFMCSSVFFFDLDFLIAKGHASHRSISSSQTTTKQYKPFQCLQP